MYQISILLKEIHLKESCFFLTQSYYFKKEKCEENWAIFKNAYLANYLSDFLQIGMYRRVYGGHKICKFDRNWCSSYRDMRC